jgi:hypothetical protein
MNYVIEIIEKEISILKRCLNEWESYEYPDAKKEREKKLKQLNYALNILNKEKYEI